ncbi:succinate dehydrogenase, hydrophobic membrane anchor protein [Sphingomonas jatrophae]|uniref:Succinate dehydrogenase hydrophobic membrane anchor subunit n=1 Tax=Sphingomonas jatrophae TaxID=1166337 RepID=A0A1I6LDK5_9SPHN|nr:succinate dehydrogenase, hydrophobic membrane anchor protein [Sphingomonas jatrophae]SFS01549.1 succinate dehydrogenase subunit D [Sphingomonas jatrophae]
MGTGTGIGRVRGLGSAKSGAHHWWMQRVTAAGNLLLVVWFVLSIVRLPSLDYRTVTLWLSSPFVAVPLVLLVINTFYHFRLGLQVVLEDYQKESSKVAGLIAINFFTIGAGALAIFSILKIAFAGAR